MSAREQELAQEEEKTSQVASKLQAEDTISEKVDDAKKIDAQMQDKELYSEASKELTDGSKTDYDDKVFNNDDVSNIDAEVLIDHDKENVVGILDVIGSDESKEVEKLET